MPKRILPIEYYFTKDLNGCWPWHGGVTSSGYGSYGSNRNKISAHRVLYEQYKGKIPFGYVVDHICNNKLCVNPDHLQAILQSANVRRGHLCKLSNTDIVEIRSLADKGETQLYISRRFNITKSHVSRIVNNKRWN